MGVAAEVVDDVAGLLEGRLGVDVPRELADLGDEAPEGGRVVQELDVGEEAGGVGLAEDVQDLAAEQLAHDLDGEEEVAAKVTEALPIEREAAGGDDRVHVRVEGQLPGPGVQHERGAEPGAEPAVAELEQGLGGGVKERVEDHVRGAAREGSQLGRQGEDDVEVPDVEQALAALLDPMLLGERLTLRAVPVAARMVRVVHVPARRAVLDMASERGGAALRDVRQHPLLRGGEQVQDLELCAVRAHDVGDVEPRSPDLRRARGHGLRPPHLASRRQQLERARRVAHERRRDTRVARRRLQAPVAEQRLDDAHVGAGVEQVGGVAVPQHVGPDPLGDPGLLGGGRVRVAHRLLRRGPPRLP